MKSHFSMVLMLLKWLGTGRLLSIGMFIGSLISLSPAYGGSQENISIHAAFFLKNSSEQPAHALLVEKKSQKLYLLNYGKEISLIKIYYCSTGQQEGNKKEQGDFKTPEGIYFFNEIKQGDNLPARYGAMAFVMDYPNRFDKIENKNGYGIWLHATNEPNRALLPNVTEGCVVVRNEDIVELSQFIKLFETPIVVVDEIPERDTADLATLTGSIEDFLLYWKKSWEGENLDRYMDTYSKEFASKSMNWSQWKRYKRNLNKARSRIRVDIEDLKIIRYKSRAILVFNQRYASNGHSDTGIKIMYIWEEDGKWKIVGETWKSSEELLALEENKKDSTHGRR